MGSAPDLALLAGRLLPSDGPIPVETAKLHFNKQHLIGGENGMMTLTQFTS
jgi:hypothetical protein